MNITRNLRIAAVTAIACVGIGTATSTPAVAFTPVKTISNGPVKPVVVWDQAAWKKCYSLTYAQWRESGASPSTSQSAADLTCGTQP